MIKKVYSIVLFIALFILNNSNLLAYNRIVSLAPSLTKNIYFLNSQDKLIGCTSYCEIAKKDNKNIVASAIQVNIEKVISLNPDLIIATSITNPETIQTLKKFGIRVEIFKTPHSFDEICVQFSRLGTLIGKDELAGKIVVASQEKVDSIVSLAVNFEKFKVFFQIGAEPIFTVLSKTFMDDYIRFINGANISEKLTKGAISRESVIVSNPDVIFIVTMGIIGEKEKQIWTEFNTINAVKNKKVFIIDSDMACTPTPLTFVQTLETIVELIK